MNTQESYNEDSEPDNFLAEANNLKNIIMPVYTDEDIDRYIDNLNDWD